MMPTGFFPAVERQSPVVPLLERLRPAVEAELERHGSADATVHAELRTARTAGGELAMRRFYWSTQRAEPSSPWGFAARTLVCDDDAAALRVHEFPSDPALPWLGEDPGPLRLAGTQEHVEVLRYIPLRRLTFRLHDGAGLPPRVIAKAKRASGLNRAATAFLAVHLAANKRRSDAPTVPRLLRLEPPRHVLYLEELPGRTLDVAIGTLDLVPAMEQLGTLHRSLQELEVRGLTARRTAGDWLDDARSATSQIGLFVPSAARRAAEVHAGLVRNAPADERLLFCQGDFLPGQVLHHPSRWSVIDFDDSRYADPLSEVAAMYAAMPRELHLGPAAAEKAQRAYLRAYAARAGEPIDEARWRWYLALLQLTELGKRLMKGRVAPEETHAVLDRLTQPDHVTPG
jgi:Ser/Thr protein kinase RdoA (MazF antagonist)